MDAAQAVARCTDVARNQILDQLSLLGTVRHYAVEKLSESGEARIH